MSAEQTQPISVIVEPDVLSNSKTFKWVHQNEIPSAFLDELRCFFSEMGEISRSYTAFSKALQFKNSQEQLSFLFLLHAVSFGSSYRHIVQADAASSTATTATSHFEVSARFGMMNLFLSKDDLTAKTLAGLCVEEVSEMFSIPLTVEGPLDGPDSSQYELLRSVVTVTKPAPQRDLANAITQTLHEVAKILRRLNFSSCGDWLLSIVEEVDDELTCAFILKKLVDTFPSIFNDIASYEECTVPFHQKARGLVACLHSLLGPFDDYPRFLVLPDVRVAGLFNHAGLLAYDQALSARVCSATQQLSLGSQEEVEIRAATASACMRLLDHAPFVDSAGQLVLLLNKLALDQRYTNIAQHRTVTHLY